jgi:hypothetical protein
MIRSSYHSPVSRKFLPIIWSPPKTLRKRDTRSPAGESGGGIATTPRRVHIKDPITLADCNNTLNTNGHFSLWLFSSSFPRFYFPSYSEKVIQRTMF